MKRLFASILISICIIMSVPVVGFATSNQNLEWGVEIGSQFDYHFQYDDYAETEYSTEFDCYIIVESLPLIPDDISELFTPLFFNVTADLGFYFENGTDMGPWATYLPQMILPIGNWSLWSYLLEDWEASSSFYYDSINTTETATSWTWKRASQYDDIDLTGHAATVIFRKSDGVLSYLQYTGFNNIRNKYFEYEIVRSDYAHRFDSYLVVAGIIVAVVAVVILYKKK